MGPLVWALLGSVLGAYAYAYPNTGEIKVDTKVKDAALHFCGALGPVAFSMTRTMRNRAFPAIIFAYASGA